MEFVAGLATSRGDWWTHGSRSDVTRLDSNAVPKATCFFIHGTVNGWPASAILRNDGLEGSSSSICSYKQHDQALQASLRVFSAVVRASASLFAGNDRNLSDVAAAHAHFGLRHPRLQGFESDEGATNVSGQGLDSQDPDPATLGAVGSRTKGCTWGSCSLTLTLSQSRAWICNLDHLFKSTKLLN